MTTPTDDLLRLRASVADGRLEQVCRKHGLALCVLHGSSTHTADPGDVDLAVAWQRGCEHDLVALVTDLIDLVGSSVDVLDLDAAGPVAAQRALTGGVPLVEVVPHTFATRQMRAIRDFIDTAPLRALDLQILAG